MKELHMMKGLKVQPYMTYTVDSDEYNLVINEHRWTFGSICETMDVLVKLTYLMDFEFNAFIVPFWDFICSIFYGLPSNGSFGKNILLGQRVLGLRRAASPHDSDDDEDDVEESQAM